MKHLFSYFKKINFSHKFRKDSSKTKKFLSSNLGRNLSLLFFAILTGGTLTALTSYAASISASNISYSNSTSGLTATNVQSAIDELKNSVGDTPSSPKVGDTVSMALGWKEMYTPYIYDSCTFTEQPWIVTYVDYSQKMVYLTTNSPGGAIYCSPKQRRTGESESHLSALISDYLNRFSDVLTWATWEKNCVIKGWSKVCDMEAWVDFLVPNMRYPDYNDYDSVGMFYYNDTPSIGFSVGSKYAAKAITIYGLTNSSSGTGTCESSGATKCMKLAILSPRNDYVGKNSVELFKKDGTWYGNEEKLDYLYLDITSKVKIEKFTWDRGSKSWIVNL